MANLTIDELTSQPSPSADDQIEIQQASDDLSRKCTLEQAMGAARPRVITMAVVEETDLGYVGRVPYGRGFTITKIEVFSLAEDGLAQTVAFDLLAGLYSGLGSTPPVSILGADPLDLTADSYNNINLLYYDTVLPDDGYLELEILSVASGGASAIVRIEGT